MSTFNDLNRVMEDTIRVDMKKRWTPQEVKFINNKNEYFGTFHGKIESIGAVLSDVELSNVTMYNENGEKVDINKLLGMELNIVDLEDKFDKLSLYVDTEFQDTLLKKMKEFSNSSVSALTQEIEKIKKVDANLQDEIDCINSAIKDESEARQSADVEIKKHIK